MSSRKILFVVAGITLLVWIGTAIYLLQPFKKSTPLSQKLETQVPVPSSGRSYITIEQPNQFQGFYFQVTLEGAIKEIGNELWIISGKNGGDFKIKPDEKSRFLSNKSGKDESVSEEDFKQGDRVEAKLIKIFLPRNLFPESPVIKSDLSTWHVLEIRRFL